MAIAIRRSLGVPARYVSAYAFSLVPPDFHAVFEAYLEGPNGGGWYLFDATRLADPAGLIRIGAGRDASDVAFRSPYGPIEYDRPDVWIGALEQAGPSTTQAVFTQGVRGLHRALQRIACQTRQDIGRVPDVQLFDTFLLRPCNVPIHGYQIGLCNADPELCEQDGGGGVQWPLPKRLSA